MFFSLFSKSVFYAKLGISLLLAKSASADLALKISAVNLLISSAVIYLPWS